ncbi:SUF system NifU family Fe-S cluster assembly protein [Brevibacterium sp. 5221]|uniref:SUF system NifU family Fe-S cluster assembly protein n=1 Tax=Brevibacterium rongguiense TaxID=2695267 RepID=A0A6N9H5M5_9MICO|nr:MULTISPECIES: SUF system NifU family Fe-S cluster assembly protein [Brevibacterium]MYM19151.1 SUF system NifU family Fe-S cluster assembly protein [Brevibacterium rongguiense]WAL40831.1 SUF system NifU family Fe-S cluster assembly protein [Brevibacterium sp. BRM-1]
MSGLDQLYQQLILDHAKRRTGNMPLLGAAEPPVGASHQINPTCGDEITVEARRDPATGRLLVRWDGEGCSISMASASAMTELAEECDPEGFNALEARFHELMHSRGQAQPDEEALGDAAAFAGVSKFPARVKCALLAWMALKDAVYQIEGADRA